jgi:hypothetical protein
MDSTTSRALDASDEPDDGEVTTAEHLDALAAAPPSDRALGSAVLLSGGPLPTRANLGNPPRSAQKNRRSGPIGPGRTGS